METIFIGKNCIEVEKTDSTNSYLARLTSPPTPLLQERGGNAVFEGTVVIARHQEQGRGQRGSTWESEPNKNLTLSILFQPSFLRPDEQFMLNKAVSLGVAEFVLAVMSPFSEGNRRRLGTKFEGDVRIKWPNDIYIGNKKVAGILIENSMSGSTFHQSIIGIGINVNQEKFSAKLPNPTSLKLVAGKEFDLDECLAQLCSYIESRYLQLKTDHYAQIDTDYLKNLYRFGEWANYKRKSEIFKAKSTGVTKAGKLILETEKGKILECDFKEVEFC
jgi:BirA family biotin operon repressor/biotin-[acetyl-CoA-carboxylase] ligase